jgi:hypothetical protein
MWRFFLRASFVLGALCALVRTSEIGAPLPKATAAAPTKTTTGTGQGMTFILYYDGSDPENVRSEADTLATVYYDLAPKNVKSNKTFKAPGGANSTASGGGLSDQYIAGFPRGKGVNARKIDGLTTLLYYVEPTGHGVLQVALNSTIGWLQEIQKWKKLNPTLTTIVIIPRRWEENDTERQPGAFFETFVRELADKLSQTKVGVTLQTLPLGKTNSDVLWRLDTDTRSFCYLTMPGDPQLRAKNQDTATFTDAKKALEDYATRFKGDMSQVGNAMKELRKFSRREYTIYYGQLSMLPRHLTTVSTGTDTSVKGSKSAPKGNSKPAPKGNSMLAPKK